MHYNEYGNQFDYIINGIMQPRNCDLSSYLTLDKKKNKSVNDTHITTDKSKSQMKK